MQGPGDFKTDSEFFRHEERPDGTRDLYFGQLGEEAHGHAVLDPYGNLKYLRESDGRVVADDQFHQ